MLYLIKFVGDSYPGLYYSDKKSWGGVPKAEATPLIHKRARQIRDHLRQARIGVKSVLEEFKENDYEAQLP